MNLLCDISIFNTNHLFFLDTKKNMVIDGKFTKLVYSDSMVSLNGLYLYCPIDVTSSDPNGCGIHPYSHKGSDPLSPITTRPQTDGHGRSYKYGIDSIRQRAECLHTWTLGKEATKSVPTLGKEYDKAFTGVYKSNRYTNEEGCTIVTKKIPILFSILNPTNLQIMKELNRIEHEILEYYNEYFKMNKVNVYSLRNQLKSGNIRVVHKVTEPRSDDECDRSLEHRPLVVKISGIWETDMNVGITFKFQR